MAQPPTPPPCGKCGPKPCCCIVNFAAGLPGPQGGTQGMEGEQGQNGPTPLGAPIASYQQTTPGVYAITVPPTTRLIMVTMVGGGRNGDVANGGGGAGGFFDFPIPIFDTGLQDPATIQLTVGDVAQPTQLLLPSGVILLANTGVGAVGGDVRIAGNIVAVGGALNLPGTWSILACPYIFAGGGGGAPNNPGAGAGGFNGGTSSATEGGGGASILAHGGNVTDTQQAGFGAGSAGALSLAGSGFARLLFY